MPEIIRALVLGIVQGLQAAPGSKQRIHAEELMDKVLAFLEKHL